VRTASRIGTSTAVAVLVLIAAGSASAVTYVVQPDGLGDYPTIQEAVDAADDGDYVVLTDGTFSGPGNRDIVVPAKQIYILSQSGNFLECQIDCEGSAGDPARGFHFNTSVGSGNAEMQGVGVINGYVFDGGGGIWIEGADTRIINCSAGYCTVDNTHGKGGGLWVSDGGAPNVSGCLFHMNSAGKGGGVAIDTAWGTFNYCEMVDNTATDMGGGMFVYADGPFQIGYSDFLSNQAPHGGGVLMSGTTPYVQHCKIYRNDATAGFGGGVYLQGGSVNHCTIVDNSATEGAGGVHCHAGTGTVEYSIIAFSESGYGVAATDGYAPTLNCCDVYGNPAGEYDSVVGDQTGINDNFSLDPLFCNWPLGDYTLDAASLCLYGNNPCGYQVGAFGQGCDSPVEDVSWGRVKALWR